MLGFMGQPPDARLTPQLARQICERAAGAAFLEGSIKRLGTRYVLWLSARDCRTGETIDEEQAQAERKEEVLNALGRIAGKFRVRLGESQAMVQKHETPLEDATTPSPEALKAYTNALKVWRGKGGAAALPFAQRAIDIDPNFAMAHVNILN